MNPTTRILTELLSVLGGIPEDAGNYRTRCEAINLANQLAKALEAAQ